MPHPLTLAVGLDDGCVESYFGVEHEGGLWLVTAWLIDLASGDATPERMIRLDSLEQPPQRCPPGERFDFVVPLLPKAVIHGLGEETPGFEVRSLPATPKVAASLLKPLPSIGM